MADEEEKKEDEAPAAEAPTEGAEGEEDEEGGKKKKSKLPLIIILVVVLLGGGAGVFFSGILGGGEEEKKEEHAEEGHGDDHAKDEHGDEDAKDDAHGKDEHGDDRAEGKEGEEGKATAHLPVYYELPDFIVNLNTGGRRTSFLKMKVVLELANPDVALQIDAYKPRILDAFNTYLRELRTSDLAGSAGIYRLRRELMSRITKSVGDDVVLDILFKEIVVQ